MKSAVIGIVFADAGRKVLVIKRRDVPMWVFPGGGIDNGEHPDQAVLREIKEETGFETEIVRKVAEYTPINRLSNYTHLYECKIIGGHPILGDETKDLGFYPVEKMPTPFFTVHHEWLSDALKNETDIIRKPILQVTYSALFKYFCRHPLLVLRFSLSKLGMPLNSKF